MPFALTTAALIALLLGGCDDEPPGDDTGPTRTDLDRDGWTVADGDCNDHDPSVHPGATEVVADGIDQNCFLGDDCYLDADGDGYGSTETITSADLDCEDGVESTLSTDCDDRDSAVHPGAEEIEADRIDQDCDGGDLCYTDSDGDGYGTSIRVASTDLDCSDTGESVLDTDCDDEDPGAYPSGLEVPYDGVDQDCDGDDLTDVDGDGYDWEKVGGDDCNDEDPGIHPGAAEVCWNGIDDDCDGMEVACPLTGTISLSLAADATFRGAEEGAWAGYWVAPAGDFDADGTRDIAIASPCDEDSDGTVKVMFGPLSGFYDLGEADVTFRGSWSTYGWAGQALDGGLDTNGDDVGAIVFSAGEIDEAVSYAFLVEGPVSGTVDLPESDCMVVGEVACDWAGYSVAAAGDVTGDGVDDWLVGAMLDSTRGFVSGAAYVVSGEKRGTWSLADVDAKLLAENDRDHAGYLVASAGDVNGDGLDDILVSATAWVRETYVGAAYLLYGPVSGTIGLETADAIFRGERARDWFAAAFAAPGDMDGDGLGDLVITSRWRYSAYVYNGAPTGERFLSGADAVLVGEGVETDVGISADAAGDVDGDGNPDIVIGARLDYEAGEDAGAAWLVYGPVVGTSELDEVGTKFLGIQDDDITGESVAGVGDIDGDGLDDFLIGAPNAEGGTAHGLAFLIYGRER